MQPYNGYNTGKNDIIIDNCRLIMTSVACPEQYDVFDETTQQQIGYLRLRHGYFRADYRECGGETVYDADTKGDGMFDDDYEREQHLNAAVTALRKHHEQQ